MMLSLIVGIEIAPQERCYALRQDNDDEILSQLFMKLVNMFTLYRNI